MEKNFLEEMLKANCEMEIGTCLATNDTTANPQMAFAFSYFSGFSIPLSMHVAIAVSEDILYIVSNTVAAMIQIL